MAVVTAESSAETIASIWRAAFIWSTAWMPPEVVAFVSKGTSSRLKGTVSELSSGTMEPLRVFTWRSASLAAQ
jgi:hypothetical protein